MDCRKVTITSGSLLTAIEHGLQQFCELIASYRVVRFRSRPIVYYPFPTRFRAGFIIIPVAHGVASLARSPVACKGYVVAAGVGNTRSYP